MVKSMTGFGRGEYSDEQRTVTAEIKSVNHRYGDITVKMPRRYQFAEESVKNVIREYLSRGKIECSIQIDSRAEEDIRISLNRPLVQQYLNNFQALREEFGVPGEVTLELIAGLPDIMKQDPGAPDEEAVTKALCSAVREAAQNIDRMRAVEGAKLAQDLTAREETIRGLVDQIAGRAKDVPNLYRDKLRARLEDLLSGSGVEVPADQLAYETAAFADKADVTEELTRLCSHLDQMDAILASDEGAEGKKLDFLVQEMNREANTIGSKANDLGVTNLMLQVKAEVEKIREQVQNIE